ncbi:tRNA (adenosine(37)-N6)-threonylcarbamoyltransferase complex transferase subunit TsaD [Algicella marina]|uniref:tRNA N6-adenosine threonylcarbamoyltransferase n=1 Tax=Algicella marina TaxID=2683284 RepID=A0A6P1T2F5_9RHOB|nr:tRNA (adenosine(37)-N6)-threonylcarbamoyltransferase complex transferase subunit TsaD [Algicella marina]QHQ36898.1 tRNA (adenosine(37)-N6)-threonylcarbamoyltransferase complex transferase subunit TsaD [Algicella marina]
MLCLGIESSCDDTGAAVVDDGRTIVSNVVLSQNDLHERYGGVVPEIAARAHAERLDDAISRALQSAGVSLNEIDLIAATSGPGLIGGLLSGLLSAKAISLSRGIPFVGVNHLAGHALTPRLTDCIAFPYLMLLISGGHCQFLIVESASEFHRIGGTIDDAPGEAFDKTARLLGLGYPGGPQVERCAAEGDATRFLFPRPLLDSPGCDMSFSGLKTALRRATDEIANRKGGLSPQDRNDLAAGFQAAVRDVLIEKTRRAWAMFEDRHGPYARHLAVAGGVAANSAIRSGLQSFVDDAGALMISPPLSLCTDNAAMIAWAGIETYKASGASPLDLPARPRWPLDNLATALIGFGKRGAKA